MKENILHDDKREEGKRRMVQFDFHWHFLFADPPVRAKLVREWNHFVAGEVYNVSCQVLGSRPPAQTTIFIGSSQLREIKYEVSSTYEHL